jgi:sugar phosphate permease
MATPEPVIRSDARPRWHYAFVVAAVTFGVILVTAGVRAAPGAFIVPLENEYGWSRGSISLAVALSILAYGFGAPLAGGLIDRYGPRRLAVTGCFLIAAGLLPMLWMTQEWQLFLFWGLIVGVGTGAVGGVLGATVATRWFRSQRGLVIGLFSAASSMGQLIFLPSLVTLIVASGWRAAVAGMAGAVLLAAIPAFLFLRDRPADIGIQPYGDDGSAAAAAAELTEAAEGSTLRQATRTRDFWLLAGSFFVCGYTSNGIIGTHLIPHAVEHGFSVDTAAAAVGLMGMMNVVGTLTSGWLTDRYDNRKLLAFYYTFRALSIVFLPVILAAPQLFLFAIVYGLDWIATVPPTVNLTARLYGRAHMGTIYGWIFCSHMIGAALAAYLGGAVHDILGDYTSMFLSAGLLGFIAAAMALRVSVTGRPGSTPAPSVSAA